MKTTKQLQAMFLDYFNNYLSIERYADNNDLTIPEAKALIELGRVIHERLVTENSYKKESKEAN